MCSSDLKMNEHAVVPGQSLVATMMFLSPACIILDASSDKAYKDEIKKGYSLNYMRDRPPWLVFCLFIAWTQLASKAKSASVEHTFLNVWVLAVVTGVGTGLTRHTNLESRPEL